jgi:hypothetical protein
MLAMRRDLSDLKAMVEHHIRTGKHTRVPMGTHMTGYLSILVRFFETKLGQALLAIGTPVMVALLKWLLGNS